MLIRRSTQLAFLWLNLWIGVRFFVWVRFFETGGESIYVPRPAGVGMSVDDVRAFWAARTAS